MSVVHIDTAIKKANELLKEYEKDHKEHYDDNIDRTDAFISFGEWVLHNYYPYTPSDSHPSIRDMVTTARTSDARTWLIANIMSGRLTLSK
jgi:hypothetical protein